MAASKLQRRISQHVHKIATKFQRPPMLLESNKDSGIVVRPNGIKPEGENQDGGLETSKNIISAGTQDSNEIPTALPMFLKFSYLINLVAMVYEQRGGNQKWKNQDGSLKTSNTCISACTQGSNDIITALPMFSGSGNTTRLMRRLLDE